MPTLMHLEDSGLVGISFFAALVGALVLTPLVIRMARVMGWVAEPRDDRWHTRPTALSGGLAIYVSATLALLVTPGIEIPWIIWGGATLMFGAGFLDDRIDIHPVAKFVVQIAAAGVLLLGGYRFAPHWPLWLSIPLTFFWVIGITNAINLLDNMDGLAGGITAIAAVMLGFFAAGYEQFTSLAVALAIVGSTIGFLRYNLKPSRIFMGDCGSLFLGYVIAALGLMMQSVVPSSSILAVLLVPAAVMAVPIFDTTLVTINRILAGRSISRGGRDHSSHRLVFLGLSEEWAVYSLYGVSFAFGLLALIFHQLDVRLFYALATYMGVGLAVFGRFLAHTDVYSDTDNRWKGHILPNGRSEGVLLRSVLKYKRELAGLIADGLLLGASLVIAVHLRYEDGVPALYSVLLETYIPIVIIPKLILFYLGGLYDQVWRNAGTLELARVGAVTLVASLSTYVLCRIFVSPTLSEAVFTIDWMLTFLAIGGVRFGFRGLRNYLASKRSRGRRVLLYGAGDLGTLSVRVLRTTPSLDYHPVGFLDDDPEKHGRVVQGLPIFGSSDDLEEVCRDNDVEEILVTTDKLPDQAVDELVSRCRDREISCREFQMSFDLATLADDRGREKETKYPVVNGMRSNGNGNGNGHHAEDFNGPEQR